MAEPLVSIVIPCYRQAHWLPEAIESALAQTYESVEVVVVNDGSDDGTSDVARKYHVKLVEQENRGLSGARNSGIQWASGEYILPLDADDRLDPDYLDLAVGYKDADIVGTYQQEFGERDKLHQFRPNPVYADFLAGNQINCCSLFKKEMWKKLGGYDETLRHGLEDYQFWLRAVMAGYKVAVVPFPLFFYRIHSDSMIHRTNEHYEEVVAEVYDSLAKYKK